MVCVSLSHAQKNKAPNKKIEKIYNQTILLYSNVMYIYIFYLLEISGKAKDSIRRKDTPHTDSKDSQDGF